MLSKSKITYIRSLEQKKYRQAEQIFIAEGVRIADEVLRAQPSRVVEIFATEKWLESHPHHARNFANRITTVGEAMLERISLLTTPNDVLILVRMTETPAIPTPDQLAGQLHLALYNIQDPGNMGTILRIADWFGISRVFCTPSCVDAYNPKVVQATMGSLFRTQVFYTDMPVLLQQSGLNSYAATLDGENVWSLPLPKVATDGGFLVIGNEAHGIGDDVLAHCTNRIAIPQYGKAESLNAGVATGILCAILRQHR